MKLEDYQRERIGWVASSSTRLARGGNAEGHEEEAWAPELGPRDDPGAAQDPAGGSRSHNCPGSEFLSEYCGPSQDAAKVHRVP